MSKYRSIQLTNNAVGTVAANSYMPLGVITRKIACQPICDNTYTISVSTPDIVYLNEPGYYNIMYSARITASATGTIGLSLIVNGTQTYSVSETVSAADDVINLTLPYQTRVFCNCATAPTNVPTSIQIQLTGVGITAGTTNLQVERVF